MTGQPIDYAGVPNDHRRWPLWLIVLVATVLICAWTAAESYLRTGARARALASPVRHVMVETIDADDGRALPIKISSSAASVSICALDASKMDVGFPSAIPLRSVVSSAGYAPASMALTGSTPATVVVRLHRLPEAGPQ